MNTPSSTPSSPSPTVAPSDAPLYWTRTGCPVHPGVMTWCGRKYWVDAGGDWWERTDTGALTLRWKRRRATQ